MELIPKDEQLEIDAARSPLPARQRPDQTTRDEPSVTINRTTDEDGPVRVLVKDGIPTADFGLERTLIELNTVVPDRPNCAKQSRPKRARAYWTRERIIETFDLASAGSNDDKLWSCIMRDLLVLPLCYFLAVQEALREGRWRTSKYPLAYVRKVAQRLAVKMGLDDDRDLPYKTLSLPQNTKGGWVSFEKYYDSLASPPQGKYVRNRYGQRIDFEACLENDNADDYVDSDTGDRFSRLESLLKRLPPDLSKSVELPAWQKALYERINAESDPYDRYLDTGRKVVPDWERIAETFGLDAGEKMVLRCHIRGVTRNQAVRMEETEDGKRRVQAAWKRFERHLPKIRDLLVSPFKKN